MTWKEAKLIAVNHIRRLGLPRRLDGVLVLVTDYDDEGTLRFMKPEEPDITLQSQRLINQAFRREMRKRGARVRSVKVVRSDYFAWLARCKLKDSPANRAQFISWLTAPDPKPIPI
jgi:hypothetical protein